MKNEHDTPGLAAKQDTNGAITIVFLCYGINLIDRLRGI